MGSKPLRRALFAQREVSRASREIGSAHPSNPLGQAGAAPATL